MNPLLSGYAILLFQLNELNTMRMSEKHLEMLGKVPPESERGLLR